MARKGLAEKVAEEIDHSQQLAADGCSARVSASSKTKDKHTNTSRMSKKKKI